LDLSNSNTKQAVETVLANLAKNDKKSLVRADAILKLGEFEKADYADLFKKATADSSYTIAGAALISLSAIDPEAALAIAKELVKQPSKGLLTSAIMGEIVKSGDESYAEKIISDFAKLPVSQAKFESVATVSAYLAAVSDLKTFKWGIDEIVKFRNAIPAAYSEQTDS